MEPQVIVSEDLPVGDIPPSSEPNEGSAEPSEQEPETQQDPPLAQTPLVPAPEALAFAAVCEQLGFDPAATKSITFSGAGVVAVAATYPEPFKPVEVSDGV